MVPATQMMRFTQQFNRFYARQFASLIEETGLSMREFYVLLFLINNPGYDTARDVSEYRGLAKSQVSQAVELLSDRGLLCRSSDPTDRRVIHLSLTETGQAMANRAQEIQNRCFTRLMAGFTPEEAAQFHAYLERVLKNGSALNAQG